jgi:hypothetical protein
MSKHTPGPWAIGDYDKLTVLTANRELRIAAADFQTRQAVANAQLIAAAPDLVEAVRHALECIQWHDSAGMFENSDGVTLGNVLRNALEKAGVQS